MNEDIRTVQAAIYRCMNTRAVEADPEKKKRLAQEEQTLRQQLRDLKKPRMGGKPKPWVVLMDVKRGRVIVQPFFPTAFNLPDVILLEMMDIVNAAAVTIAFIRELGVKANIEMTRELAQKNLRDALGLHQLRVVNKAELLVMAKRGEAQVRFTTDDEDRRTNERLMEVHHAQEEGPEGDSLGLRPGPQRLRSGGPGRVQEVDGTHGPPI